MKNLAIIPARGGSKRIPDKNIRNFLGRPVIEYSINAALKCKLFDSIMVSTDSQKIADIAKHAGAEVPFLRSVETSNDTAILNEVYTEVLTEYMKIGVSFDYVCLILATAPLIKSKRIKESYLVMLEKGYDSIRPIVEFSYPIQRAYKYEDGNIQMFYPENYTKRSQDLAAAYHDAGQFYWIKGNSDLRSNNKGAIIIPRTEAQDIDDNEDWIIAEMKYKLLNAKHNI